MIQIVVKVDAKFAGANRVSESVQLLLAVVGAVCDLKNTQKLCASN